MTYHNDICTVVFETYDMEGDVAIRLIAFGRDEDTGARHVIDILECNYDKDSGRNWLTRTAAEYAEESDADVEYFFRLETTDTMESATTVNLDNIDTGRARKLESRINKAVDYIVAENT